MKSTVAYLAGLLALGGIVAIATTGRADPQSGSSASQPQRSKIALINIAKVLKEYKRANVQGQEIASKRKQYLDQVNALRNAINDKNKQIADPKTLAAQKEALQKEMVALQRQIEDIDRTAQKELTELSNNTIVKVYNEIQETTKAFADAYGFELILAYPDATTPTEANSPVVAQLKLQTPALMPFYHKNVDITDSVIKALNDRYPAPEVKASTSGTVTPASSSSPMR